MITKDKIAIYKKYDADPDLFARCGTSEEKRTLDSESFF